MTDGQNPLAPTVTNRNSGDSEEGHVCVCTGVKFSVLHILHSNKLNPHLTKISRKGEGGSVLLSNVNMLSELSSQ